MHRFDAVDVIEQSGTSALRVTVHCPAAEWGISKTTSTPLPSRVVCNSKCNATPRCPPMAAPVWFSTSPGHVLALAADLARIDGVRCVALLLQRRRPCLSAGLRGSDRAHPDLAKAHVDALHALGGEWHSRHLPPPTPSAIEAAWIATLGGEALHNTTSPRFPHPNTPTLHLRHRTISPTALTAVSASQRARTYKLTGDENNSPRGRLRLWSEEAAGRLPQDTWTDFYTAECVGCLACETACPANVPYGELFERIRHNHVATHRFTPKWPLRLAASAVAHPVLFDLALLPARLLRRAGLNLHRFLFPGRPAVLQSTAAYARELMLRHRPTGPRVAFLAGCLMEAMFRESTTLPSACSSRTTCRS